MRNRVAFQRFDKALFFTPILIFLIGLTSIYSASIKGPGAALHQTLAAKQVLWMGIGVLLVILMARTDYFKLQDWAWPLYFMSLVLLVLVLFTPARLGAHRWFRIMGFNFQPSELAKLATLFVLSRYFTTHRIENATKRDWALPFVIVGAPFLLIMKEPDLGTALLLIPAFLAMLYLWGARLRVVAYLLAGAAVASPFLFQFLKGYQKTRLLVFLNPNLDPLGSGYTIIQSKIAIGSGGLFGKGFMGGSQNVLQFLPERHTDFIFGVIGEEGGFVASALILALFWLIIQKGYSISKSTPDRFGSQLACGITTLIASQAVINLGMTMGLLPVVGVPLPLVSYGGTSVIITMIFIGILLNIKIHRPLF